MVDVNDLKPGDRIVYKWDLNAGSYEDHLELFPDLYNGVVLTVEKIVWGFSVAVIENEQIVFVEEIEKVL